MLAGHDRAFSQDEPTATIGAVNKATFSEVEINHWVAHSPSAAVAAHACIFDLNRLRRFHACSHLSQWHVVRLDRTNGGMIPKPGW